MAGTIREKMEATGNRIAEKATEFKNTVAEKAEEAADWAKEKTHQAGNRLEELGQKAEHKYEQTVGSTATSATIQEHMNVLGSCGNMLGRVDHVQGNSIKLTKHDSADGMHHLIPLDWVDHVDSQVHLTKSCATAKAEWQTV